MAELLQFYFYVPESHLEKVKAAVFQVGAGKIGQYDGCCWQVKGVGQFRPGEGARPFLGQRGQYEQVEEWKVEMVVDARLRKPVLEAFRAAHPYEEPAYGFIPIEVD